MQPMCPNNALESVFALLRVLPYSSAAPTSFAGSRGYGWPHSTLGWPDETPELKYYYPTSLLSTSRDIITLGMLATTVRRRLRGNRMTRTPEEAVRGL